LYLFLDYFFYKKMLNVFVVMVDDMFSRGFLLRVRGRALRRGVWFSALDRVERGILGLAVRVVDRVQSVVLGVELVKILAKLRDALRSGFVRRMEEYGLRRVSEIAEQAVAWGYKGVKGWASDFSFVRYLTMMDLNRPSSFGV
jgi:hypothetical protein